MTGASPSPRTTPGSGASKKLRVLHLLFGQMVWQSGNVDRAGQEIISDLVHVDPVTGIDPVDGKLESVKKNGPFTPILKGNVNFICVKSGLFEPDPDADATCGGDPAEVIDPDGELGPSNIVRRLGLAPGESQSVRIRMEWGDFRGALLQIATGGLGLNLDNVRDDYNSTQGLARFFDCSDQRELEYCHPELVGENIGYLPNTNATWLTPTLLDDIEWVIVNQPGDAARLMNFQENFGFILAMAGFTPSAEFWAPDPNPALIGTLDEDILIRQQVLGSYGMTDVPPAATTITSTAVTSSVTGADYTYDVNATAYPGPIDYSLDTAPSGMTINDDTGLIKWTPGSSGIYNVAVRASNGTDPDALQAFKVSVATPLLDDFNRAGGKLGSNWGGRTGGYQIVQQQVDVGNGGPIHWTAGFGADQEAALTLTRIDSQGQHGLLLKANRDPSRLDAILVAYDRKSKKILVKAIRYGSTPETVGSFAVTLSNGHRLGAQALADGSVRVTVNGVRVGTANAGSFFANRSGHVGAWYGNAGRAWFDDFGGGSITP